MNQHTTTSTQAPRRARRVAATIPAALALALGGTALRADAAVTPGMACAAAKKKAAIQRYDGAVKCHVTAMQKSIAVDPACLSKVQTKFDAAFTKSEAKGGCATSGDAAAIGGMIDGQVASLNAALPWVNAYVCDVGSAGPTDCGTCLNCTLEAGNPCAAAYDTCAAASDCIAVWECINTCADDACVQSCAMNHPYGATLYAQMLNCSLGSCPVTCTY